MSVQEAVAPREEPADVVTIYDRYVDFVWQTLGRLGVRDPDLQDTLQDVFLVVHRRLSSRDPNASMSAWLFGICIRVAAANRRRAHKRYEQTVEHLPEQSTLTTDPETAAAVQQDRERALAIIDEMELEQRAVFVMFEVDEMTCQQIAATIGCPVGTAYTRLRAARRTFAAAIKRDKARLGHNQSKGGP